VDGKGEKKGEEGGSEGRARPQIFWPRTAPAIGRDAIRLGSSFVNEAYSLTVA